MNLPRVGAETDVGVEVIWKDKQHAGDFSLEIASLLMPTTYGTASLTATTIAKQTTAQARVVEI